MMNRQEVILTIKTVGAKFGRIMACLNSHEYAAGYYQAVNDMVKLFDYAPLAEDFEEERDELQKAVSILVEEKTRLKSALNERDATIEKLLKHVDIAEVLGVRPKRQDVRR